MFEFRNQPIELPEQSTKRKYRLKKKFGRTLKRTLTLFEQNNYTLTTRQFREGLGPYAQSARAVLSQHGYKVDKGDYLGPEEGYNYTLTNPPAKSDTRGENWQEGGVVQEPAWKIRERRWEARNQKAPKAAPADRGEYVANYERTLDIIRAAGRDGVTAEQISNALGGGVRPHQYVHKIRVQGLANIKTRLAGHDSKTKIYFIEEGAGFDLDERIASLTEQVAQAKLAKIKQLESELKQLSQGGTHG